MLEKKTSDFENENNFCDKDLDIKLNYENCENVLDSQKSIITIFGHKPSEIKWTNVIWLTILHVAAIYGYVHGLLNPVRFLTVWFVSLLSQFSGLGMFQEVSYEN